MVKQQTKPFAMAELYKSIKKDYDTCLDNLQNYLKKTNPTAHPNYDCSKGEQDNDSYLMFTCQNLGRKNLFSDVLAFWFDKPEQLLKIVRRLESKFLNDWNLEKQQPLAGNHSFSNIYELEQDREYIIALSVVKRKIISIQNQSVKQTTLNV